MHIIIGILLALAGIFWAFSRFVDAAGDAKASARRFSWSHKHNRRLIDTMADPREAAAILLVQIAAYEGELTERHKAAILNELRARFLVSLDEAEELFGFARLALGQTVDAANILSKVLKPIRAACTAAEQGELGEMMGAIAALDSPPTDSQTHLIQRVKHSLS